MKTFAITATVLAASLGLAACGDASEEATTGEEMAAPAETETMVVEDTDASAPAAVDQNGATLSIDNDGAAMDVNQPGMDANVDTDGNVNAEVQM